MLDTSSATGLNVLSDVSLWLTDWGWYWCSDDGEDCLRDLEGTGNLRPPPSQYPPGQWVSSTRHCNLDHRQEDPPTSRPWLRILSCHRYSRLTDRKQGQKKGNFIFSCKQILSLYFFYILSKHFIDKVGFNRLKLQAHCSLKITKDKRRGSWEEWYLKHWGSLKIEFPRWIIVTK